MALQEGHKLLVDVPECCLGRDVSRVSKALGRYQVRHYLSRTGYHRLTGEEDVLLRSEECHQLAEVPKLLLGGHPWQLRVQLDLPVDSSKLPLGEVVMLRKYCPRRAQQTLAARTQAVGHQGDDRLEQHASERPRSDARLGDGLTCELLPGCPTMSGA